MQHCPLAGPDPRGPAGMGTSAHAARDGALARTVNKNGRMRALLRACARSPATSPVSMRGAPDSGLVGSRAARRRGRNTHLREGGRVHYSSRSPPAVGVGCVCMRARALALHARKGCPACGCIVRLRVGMWACARMVRPQRTQLLHQAVRQANSPCARGGTGRNWRG